MIAVIKVGIKKVILIRNQMIEMIMEIQLTQHINHNMLTKMQLEEMLMEIRHMIKLIQNRLNF
jgi:hypothetical protein